MRQIIISNRARELLYTHPVGRHVAPQRQLADKSWEALVDDDLGFAFDCLPDPDTAIEAIVTADWIVCPRCHKKGPLLDNDCCSYCMLVL